MREKKGDTKVAFFILDVLLKYCVKCSLFCSSRNIFFLIPKEVMCNFVQKKAPKQNLSLIHEYEKIEIDIDV